MAAQMSGSFRLQDSIAGLIESGSSLEQVEHELIEPANLNGEQKAALWLYAWALSNRAIAPGTLAEKRARISLA